MTSSPGVPDLAVQKKSCRLKSVLGLGPGEASSHGGPKSSAITESLSLAQHCVSDMIQMLYMYFCMQSFLLCMQCL